MSNFFIAKLNKYGQYLWAKRAKGDGSEFGSSIAVDNDGNSYAIGYFENTISFEHIDSIHENGPGLFVVKLDSLGNFLWSKQVEGIIQGNSIAVDANENSYITGFFRDTAIFGSNTLTATGINNYFDIFIIKLNPDCDILWVKQIGGDNDDEGKGIAVDIHGDVHLTGYFKETVSFDNTSLTSIASSDIFIAKLSNETSSLRETEAELWRLYPNPVKDLLSIESEIVIDNVTLMDLSGKILIQRFIHHKQAQLNLSDLGKGLYVLQIVDDGGNSGVYKVLKE